MKIMYWINKIKWQFCSLDKRAIIAKQMGVDIGYGCKIYRDVSLGSEPYLIKLGDKVRLTSGVRLITHDGGMFVLRNMDKIKNGEKFNKIVIGNNVHIGMNAIIMPNVMIGDNVIVGAGAVVTKNIPDNSVAAGVPAKVIKSIEEYYEKNIDSVYYTKHMNSEDKKIYLLNKFKSNSVDVNIQ